MNVILKQRFLITLCAFSFGGLYCLNPLAAETEVFPASDPDNQAGWMLRTDISDEFDGETLDESKWFVQGKDNEYYIWKGRAPSQFAPHNVLVEDGKLKLRSQWEPDFKFARGEGHEGNDYAIHEGETIPVTTAGVITRKRFLNGYMEARTKAGDAAMTSSFWCIGYESELDVYEQMGKPKIQGDIREDTLKLSVHDWSPPGIRPTRKFGTKQKLPFRVADDFHVYGCEWGEDYLKCFVDGKLVYETTQEKEGDNWVLTNPLEIWFDSEIFVWLGLPDKNQLPVDYEIDYLRVWQKPQTNLLDRTLFGFEGPILFQEETRPLNLVPESSRNNDYQKFWKIDFDSSKYLSIVRNEHAASGTKSLRFAHEDDVQSAKATVMSPPGSINLKAGKYTVSMKVWMKLHSNLASLQVSLKDAKIDLPPLDLDELEEAKWVTLELPLTLDSDTSTDEQLEITVFDGDSSEIIGLLYVDDISIQKNERS